MQVHVQIVLSLKSFFFVQKISVLPPFVRGKRQFTRYQDIKGNEKQDHDSH